MIQIIAANQQKEKEKIKEGELCINESSNSWPAIPNELHQP